MGGGSATNNARITNGTSINVSGATDSQYNGLVGSPVNSPNAALNVNGTTIWTYLGIGLSVNNKPIVASENIARSQTSQASGRIQATDVLIIDEISMVGLPDTAVP